MKTLSTNPRAARMERLSEEAGPLRRGGAFPFLVMKAVETVSGGYSHPSDEGGLAPLDTPFPAACQLPPGLFPSRLPCRRLPSCLTAAVKAVPITHGTTHRRNCTI